MMQAPKAIDLQSVCEKTWPPKRANHQDGWVVRQGAGGGKRVSAATAIVPGSIPNIPAAETATAKLGQEPLFMLRQGEAELDDCLQRSGYDILDPVSIYLCPTRQLADPPERLSTFTVYPPLEIMRELWAEGGIGPERVAVMNRATGHKTGILGRNRDRAAGVAFAAIADGVAMLHALEVTKTQRRQGVAQKIVRAAACWALDKGVDWFSVVVTDANEGANLLYSSLNMDRVGQYHYRAKLSQRQTKGTSDGN